MSLQGWLIDPNGKWLLLFQKGPMSLRCETTYYVDKWSVSSAGTPYAFINRRKVGLDAATEGGLTRLLHEKRYSLFLEGHRWIDMRHYGLTDQLPLDRDGDVVFDSYPKPETEVPGS